MKKKIFISFMLIMSLLLASCRLPFNKDEYGAISDVDINENLETAKNVFDKQDDPFGYKWTTIRNLHGKFSIDVPASWNVTVKSPRLIEMNSPADDMFFPGMSFLILAKYDFDTVYDPKDFASTHNNNAYEYQSVFKDELLTLKYNTEDGERHIRTYPGYDKSESKLSFVDNTMDVCLQYKNKVTLEGDIAGDIGPMNYGYVNCYINWETYPLLITTVGPKDKIKNAKKMISYLTSSLCKVNQTMGSYTTAKFGRDFSLKVPSSLSMSSAGNVFEGEKNGLSSTSGMSLGIFVVSKNGKKMLTEQSLNNSIADKIAEKLTTSSVSGYYTIYPAFSKSEKKTANGEGALSSYFGTASYVYSDPDNIDPSHMYTNNGTYFILLSEVKGEKDIYVVACQYDAAQEKVAKAIMKKAIQTLR